jgi:pSer/pThr/pTyr-binding forkhead associated (FHA) protein
MAHLLLMPSSCTTSMGTLQFKTRNRFIPLRMHCLLGRHPNCNVRIDNPKISNEHASLHWTNGSWELRDLGSRNGTFLEGERLASGERAQLDRGSTFSLSTTTAIFVLTDASPPTAAVQHGKTGAWLLAERGMLLLPSANKPLATLFLDDDKGWYLEMGDETRPAIDHEMITLDGESFVLEIPTGDIETLRSDENAPRLESIMLRFAVAPDEEDVETTLIIEGKPHKVAPRRYHYLLATLARIWIAEKEVPHSLRGWVDRDKLCKSLDIDVTKLNVEIYRARRQLAEFGVQGAMRLVERRHGTHEIRIGVSNVEVVRW